MEQPEPVQPVRGRPAVALVGWSQETNIELAAAWRVRGVRGALLTPTEAMVVLDRGDVAIARFDVLPTLDGIEPGLDVLDELDRRGVRMVNSRQSLLNAHDKLRTAECLLRAGVPHPATAHLATARSEVLLPMPLVVKPRFGSWGVDVCRCETADELARVLQEIEERPWFAKHGALLQALLPPADRDLRLVVAAGTVVGALERVARPGEWRTNVSLGASRRPAVPTDEAVELAVRAASAIGADFVGVDLLRVDDGYTVLELNGAVEFDEAYNQPGEDVYEAVAAALELPRLALVTEAIG